MREAMLGIYSDRVLRKRRRRPDGVSWSGIERDRMAYDNLGKKQPILRDYLAAERTHLANERTLLAYLRTALIVLVTALTFLKLFEDDAAMRTVSFALIPVALGIGSFGVYRFLRMRKKLAALDNGPIPVENVTSSATVPMDE